MDLNQLKPVKFCQNAVLPALFIHGTDDELISMDHTEENFEAYKGAEKDVYYCEGGHNDPRPKEVLETIANFIKKYSN